MARIAREWFCLDCGVRVASRRKYCDACVKSHFGHPKDISKIKSDGNLRTKLRKIKGHVCSVCLNYSWNNQKIPLEVDHIDGDSKNNSFDNLRLICPNCHALTHNYKAKNKGKGTRQSRRKRYIEGKTY